jgi:hypothetical protein
LASNGDEEIRPKPVIYEGLTLMVCASSVLGLLGYFNIHTKSDNNKVAVNIE